MLLFWQIFYFFVFNALYSKSPWNLRTHKTLFLVFQGFERIKEYEMKNKNIIPKLTDFELATIFQSRVYLIKIDGNLHFLNGCYFQKLDPKSLETLILETLRAELHTMSSSKVQRVAYILNTQYSPLYFPAELEGWRGFSNGIWNCFSGAFYPYPLQQICPITFYFNNIPFFNPTDQIPTPVADSFFNGRIHHLGLHCKTHQH